MAQDKSLIYNGFIVVGCKILFTLLSTELQKQSHGLMKEVRVTLSVFFFFFCLGLGNTKMFVICVNKSHWREEVMTK